MNKKQPTNFEEFESELLKDPEIRKEYESLKPKYELIQHLIKRRNQLRMSQSQLARTVGTRQPAISRLERGDFNNVTLSTLIKVADALDLDLDISLKARRTKVTSQKKLHFKKNGGCHLRCESTALRAARADYPNVL
jgi:transcriptional regulator with XRE-family HTH domain